MYKYLELTIQHVFKANFNDTYYLETIYCNLDKLTNDKLVWINPYNNKSKINNTFIAIKSYSNYQITILEKIDNKIKEYTYSADFLHICSEDFDKSTILASHIQLRKTK